MSSNQSNLYNEFDPSGTAFTLMEDCFAIAELWCQGASDRNKLYQALGVMHGVLKPISIGLFNVPASRGPAINIATFPKPASSALVKPAISRHALASIPRGDNTSYFSDNDTSHALDDPNHSQSTAFNVRPDIATVVLDRNDDALIFLEFHFASPPDDITMKKLSLIGGFVRRNWKRDETIGPTKTQEQVGLDPILGPENIYRLTPSEKRVCRMVAEGMRPVQIADTLGLSIETIRTHLKGVFAKTNTSGQPELILMLCGHSPLKAA